MGTNYNQVFTIAFSTLTAKHKRHQMSQKSSNLVVLPRLEEAGHFSKGSKVFKSMIFSMDVNLLHCHIIWNDVCD